MRDIKLFIFLISLLLAGCAGTGHHPQTFPEKPFVDLQGHRGARGLFPENTIPAFQCAIEQNMTTLELDTHLTKDGHLIIYHDDVINPDLCLDSDNRPAAPSRIPDMTLADLKTLDCGCLPDRAFPTQKAVPGTKLISLPEFFDFIAQYETNHPDVREIRFSIEMKSTAQSDQVYMEKFADTLVNIVENAGVANRTTVQATNIEILPLIKQKNPALRTAALFKPGIVESFFLIIGCKGARNAIIEKAENAAADIISPHYLYANRYFIETCHEKGFLVIPWTVNNNKVMLKLLNNGVDGIISDYPDRLSAVYQQWLNSTY